MRARGIAVVVVTAIVVPVALGCEDEGACTPGDHGLAAATRLAPRTLAAATLKAEACATPRLAVISSQAELTALDTELQIAASAAGVDFTRERVIVRQGRGGDAIAWTVAQGDSGVIGLQACLGADGTSCFVNVLAVPALITRVESRKCDPVRCGTPPPR